ncbi:putative Pentatricopeptide repeat-containing protein [Cocos nucifera]|nr:putative Pentatricopeptide repeat-containing protein [Cocos nucifera]
MLRDGVIPNEHTYPLVLKALSRSQNKNPDQIHAQISKVGFDNDSFVQNSLVAAYAKAGHLGSARKLFDGIRNGDFISWTAMVHGYMDNDRPVDGLILFAKMRSVGVEIDEVTIVSVLKGAAMVGDIWLGKCIHGFYVECGRVKWDAYVGSALVDMYAKCGHCDDARRLFEEMPCRNVVSWSALIAGYARCNEFIDALSFFRDVLVKGMKPNQWDEAADLRMTMKGRSVEKTRGCSWIGVTGAIHEFVAFGESHSESKNIYETLDGLTKLIKLEGYVPDSHQVLFEMDAG